MIISKKTRPLMTGSLLLTWLGQLVKFAAVGVLNTVLDTGLYVFLSRWGGPFFAVTFLAKGVSYLVGVVNSFYWNKHWTFTGSAAGGIAFIPFLLVNLLALMLNAGLMHVALNLLGWNEWLALTGATGLTFGWNFMISKHFIFPQR
jgi:putative flippase GtrA